MLAVALMVIDVEMRVERQPRGERAHVLDRIDGHAHAADLAFGPRVVGVAAHLRREIEGDR